MGRTVRPIDATMLVKLVLEERDKIPLEVVERYSFGVPSPNKHGQSMRGGIRKVLRLIEQSPTLDYAPVRRGEWIPWIEEVEIYNTGGFREPKQVGWLCSKCKKGHCQMHRKFCPDCGAKMDGGREG